MDMYTAIVIVVLIFALLIAYLSSNCKRMDVDAEMQNTMAMRFKLKYEKEPQKRKKTGWRQLLSKSCKSRK